jgi:hypothetical protein
MKTRTRKIFVILIALAGIAACTSFPAPASDTDAILIVPMTVSVGGGISAFGRFEMHIQPAGGGSQESFALSPLGAYAMIKGLKAGTYTLSEIVFRYDNGALSGNSYKVDAKVVLEGRSITIVPAAFGYKIYQEGSNNMMSAGWTELTQGIADKLAKDLAKDEKVKAWQFSKTTLASPYLRQALQSAGLQ